MSIPVSDPDLDALKRMEERKTTALQQFVKAGGQAEDFERLVWPLIKAFLYKEYLLMAEPPIS